MGHEWPALPISTWTRASRAVFSVTIPETESIPFYTRWGRVIDAIWTGIAATAILSLTTYYFRRRWPKNPGQN